MMLVVDSRLINHVIIFVLSFEAEKMAFGRIWSIVC